MRIFKALKEIPLGHRIALKVAKAGDTVIKHGQDIGKVGVRNHLIIPPLDDLSNASSEAVANNIQGEVKTIWRSL